MKLHELYTKQNTELLRYIGDNDKALQNFDLNDHRSAKEVFQAIEDMFGADPHDWLEKYDIYVEEDDDLHKNWFLNIPAWAKEEFTTYFSGVDTSVGATGSSMTLYADKLLPRDTWLMHWTDDAYSIAAKGFIYGADIDTLALTTHRNDRHKKKGYNFAFIAGSRYSDGGDKYGDEFVLFQNSGVKTYHYDDEEEQIVFYGPDVKSSDIVPVKNDGGDYVIINQVTDNEIKRFDRASDAVEWVKKNYRQYKNVITVK